MKTGKSKGQTKKDRSLKIFLHDEWDALELLTLFGCLQNIYNYFFVMKAIIADLEENEKANLVKYRKVLNTMNGFYYYTTLIRKEKTVNKTRSLIGADIIPLSFDQTLRKEVWSYHHTLKVQSLKFRDNGVMKIYGDADAINYIGDMFARLKGLQVEKKKNKTTEVETEYEEILAHILTIPIDLDLIKSMRNRNYNETEIQLIKKYEILNAEQLFDLILSGRLS